MGLFDDITGFIGEVQSLRSEVTQFGSDIVKEIMTDADTIGQTMGDATNEVKTIVQDTNQHSAHDNTTLSPSE